ncbi:hypothetical protein BGX28_008213 [Mortierella sp. GBA30]|nr:hypothetical protein BGX28_008213 [Mortierella sp. GBA30]
MEAVALSLGLEESFFREMFGPDPYYRLKCARYPSVKQAATIGCGAHKDTGFLTVLLQDMVGGLQGQNPKTKQWMDTQPIPGTFIVTMGASIERLTGGLYHATVHRVLNNTSGQDRYSIPFFFDPALSATIPHQIPLLTAAKREDSSRSSTPTSPISMLITPSVLDEEEEDSDSEDELEDLVDELSTQPKRRDFAERSRWWRNGEHIFCTVQRCHPEVYSRWYCPK